MKSIDFAVDVMARAMTLRLKKHAAIAGNIANADTPGYRPNQVSFESELQRIVDAKQVDKLDQIKIKTEQYDDGMPRPDGNSVSVDKQMGAMSENAIVYNASAEFVARKIKMLKMVVG